MVPSIGGDGSLVGAATSKGTHAMDRPSPGRNATKRPHLHLGEAVTVSTSARIPSSCQGKICQMLQAARPWSNDAAILSFMLAMKQ